jgi:hypothetical protein
VGGQHCLWSKRGRLGALEPGSGGDYPSDWEDLNNERIESFLFNGESYREKLAEYLRADNSALFAKLDELIAGAMS